MATHVKRIESNVKGALDVELGDLTLVVGPSASAKTSIWNSLELIWLGGCSDVGVYDWRSAGRDLLDAVAPPDAKKLWAKATLSDGQVCTAEVARNPKTGGAKKLKTVTPVEAFMPVHPFREGLRGRPESIRAFLLQRMTESLTDADVIKRIPDLYVDSFVILRDAVRGADDSPVDLLLEVRAEAKRKANAVKKNAEQALVASQARAKGLDPEPTGKGIKAAEDAVKQATAALSAATMAPTISLADVQALHANAHTKVQQFQALDAAIKQIEAQLPPEQGANEQVERLRLALITVMMGHIDNAVDMCGVCGSAFDPMTRPWIQKQVESMTASAQSSIQIANLREKARVMQIDRDRIQTDAVKAVEAYKTAKAAAESDTSSGIDHHEALAHLADAQSALTHLNECKIAWVQVRDYKAEAKEGQTQQKQWTELAGACDEAAAALMNDTRDAYVARVNEHLPKDVQFDLALTEERGGEDVPCCRFGLRRDGHLFSALSGAELGQVVAAMTAATLTGNEELALVTLPRDVAMDRHALRATMSSLAALKNLGVQVIIFSVLTYSGQKPAHWTVVNLDADGKAKTTWPTKKTAVITPPTNGAGLPAS